MLLLLLLAKCLSLSLTLALEVSRKDELFVLEPPNASKRELGRGLIQANGWMDGYKLDQDGAIMSCLDDIITLRERERIMGQNSVLYYYGILRSMGAWIRWDSDDRKPPPQKKERFLEWAGTGRKKDE